MRPFSREVSGRCSAVGRALMADPKLLLLDEPSMGLAPLMVKEIMRVIEQLNREGVTILLVEQNSKAALQVAHYAMCWKRVAI